MKRTRWTHEAVKEFREWHEKLIKELYTGDVVKELRRNCEKFLRSVEPKTPPG
jgi:hypothetical protein